MSSTAQSMLMYEANKKSAVIAYVLWFFLGQLGVHRLYLGREGSGIFMALFCVASYILCLVLIGFVGLGILYVWWLIDALLIPGMLQDENVKLARRLSVG